MASLVIGAIAASLAPTGYAALAFSIGSAAGSMLFPAKLPTVEGPRLNDLRVQSSAYGEMLPLIYGSARVSGKLMWSQAIRQTRHESRSGGKGGGGQKVVTYTYSITCAVAVCQASAAGITGIRRIWANGELIYSVAEDATAETLIASNQGAAGMAIYNGASSQTADATIQAAVGAANCPAYRGTAYVVFNDLQLEKYGNRLPNFEFEVVTSGSAGSLPWTVQSYTATTLNSFGGQFDNGVVRVVESPYNGSSTTHKILSYGLDGTLVGTDQYTDSIVWNNSNTGHPSQSDPEVAVIRTAGDAFGVYRRGILQGATYPLGYSGSSIDVNYCDSTDVYTVYQVNLAGTAYIGLFENGINRRHVLQSSVSASLYHLCFDETGAGVLYLFGLSSILQLDMDLAVVNTWTFSTPAAREIITVQDDVMIISTFASSTTSTVTGYTLNDDGTVTTIGAATGGKGQVRISAYMVATSTKVLSFEPGLLSLAAASCSSIVSDIASRVGLAAGDIDVTGLTANVPGYIIARRMTARAAIEPLQAAFYFDATESDSKLKFVTRGGAVAVTIPEDDLAAHEAGSAMPDTVLITRAQEMELPVEVTVSYLDKDAAYQAGTQNSRRLTTSSKSTADLQLPLSLSAAQAKEIADVALFDAWTSRNGHKFSTTREYTKYEPTDVIKVVKGGVTHTVRLLAKNEAGGLIHWDAVAEDISVYTQASDAVGPSVPDGTVGLPGPTRLELLDIPLLRDQDEGAGFYVAASAYLSAWPGAQLYKSIDAGATWDELGDGYLNAAAIGYASTALGNFTGGNIFDESSTVSVVLGQGTLSSTTELAVLNGANVALIGNEIIQFKTATLTATQTYTLSGVLRGRRGTEWAMSSHATSERFVVLSSTTTYREVGSTSEIGLARHYKGVTFGGFLDDAATQEFTNTAVGLECYSPVQIGGGRNAAGDLTINWIRRTRIGGEWRDYVDAALGEASESYEIDVLNGGGAVLRTITASSQTASYTAAQQTTDFGSPQSSVSLKVYQLSATVGRGYPGTATV